MRPTGRFWRAALALLLIGWPWLDRPVQAAEPAWRIEEFVIASGGDVDRFAPAVSGSIVVWVEARAEGEVILGRDLASGQALEIATTRLDAKATRERHLAPAIDGTLVVWQQRSYADDETVSDRIYARDLANLKRAPFAISTVRGAQQMPRLVGQRVVWADRRAGDWDIYRYDLATRREAALASGPGDQLWPALSGDRAVWSHERDGVWRLAAQDMRTGAAVDMPASAGNQTSPSIDGALVVWEDTRAGRGQYDVYGYDIERNSELAVAVAPDYQLRPVVSDSLVVWEDYRGGERRLRGLERAGGQPLAVSAADGVQWQPAVDGNLLVWSDSRSGHFEIRGAWLRRGGFVSAEPDPAFAALWAETDSLVADGTTQRSWLWSPAPFATGWEPYAESPGGKRLVQYHDKSRMEITRPAASRSSRWFVTNGLLVKEMITGRVQMGDTNFESIAPATLPVAGDPNDPAGPTYASLGGLLGRPPGEVGAVVGEAIDRAGAVSAAKAPEAVKLAYLAPETRHSVAAPFWAYLNSQGPVKRGGAPSLGRLFDPVFYATGLPITEPYWTRVTVGGQPRDVLLQCFERRCLTYTPSNAAAWRVEMGNVGRHYHAWRYGA